MTVTATSPVLGIMAQIDASAVTVRMVTPTPTETPALESAPASDVVEAVVELFLVAASTVATDRTAFAATAKVHPFVKNTTVVMSPSDPSSATRRMRREFVRPDKPPVRHQWEKSYGERNSVGRHAA
jgi:short-subunit dehydrogenase